MIEHQRVQGQIRALEERKPPADVDPEEHRRINDEISRIIDKSRQYQAAASGMKVV